MAYIGQDTKIRIAQKVKAILAKYGLKGSLSIRNNMVLVLTVTSGKIDFIKNCNETCKDGNQKVKDYMMVNPYHYSSHFSGEPVHFIHEVLMAMNEGNHNNSNPSVDYFDVGWYNDIMIGKWDKPYKLVA